MHMDSANIQRKSAKNNNRFMRLLIPLITIQYTITDQVKGITKKLAIKIALI